MTARPTPVEYVAARRVLLDAMDALEEHRAAIILAGAQAIYARTGTADFDAAVAAYTTDADLALDPRVLGVDPQIDTAMQEAGFVLSPQPGTWHIVVDLGGRSITVPVDLLVPDTLAGPGTRAARLDGQAPRVARRTPGLEAVLADHSAIQISSLDPADRRQMEVSVAGVPALFVAKAHKLSDRVNAKPFKPERVNAKDASDVYRLMQAEPPNVVGRRLKELSLDPIAGPTVEAGVRHLRNLFGRRRSPGVAIAVRALGAGGVPAETVRAVLVAYVAELAAAYDEAGLGLRPSTA